MNFYLAIKESFNQRVIPVLWSSAKTYYEENSPNSDQWTWSDPWLSYDFSIDEILDQCKINPPNIFGLSVYVWNEQYMDDLAKRVKKEYPNCLIVYGGPQIDIKYTDNFFKIKYWVDVVCPSDGYGEITIKDLLDNYPIKDFELIPYIYYTNSDREKLLSKKTVEKKQFNWPTNIYEKQQAYFTDKLEEVSYAMIETTRGCPYKCIYCDWGGGTYTKVVSKPYTTILDEIEWTAKNKIQAIELASANFGILPIDLNISEYVVEINQKHGFPKLVYTENAKNNLDRVIKIKSMWAKAGLLNHYKVSFQTLNEEIKSNVQRIDPAVDKQVAAVKELQANFVDLPIKIETIIGLPGDSYQITLDQIDTIFKYELPMSRSNIWMLLPEAPAFSPELREKFKIKTVKKMFLTSIWNVKPGFAKDTGVNPSFFPINLNTESVVGTYSYSTQDFVDMFVVTAIAQAGDSTGINSHLIKYIVQQHNIKPSEVISFIFENFVKKTDRWQDDNLKQQFAEAYNKVDGWVHGDVIDNGFDYHNDFPLVLPIHLYIPFIILINLKSFYNEICAALAEKYNDQKIIDLGHFLSNSIIDLLYNPGQGREFSTDYNWLDYFKTGKLSNEKNKITFALTDQTVYTNGNYQPIDWHTISDDIMQVKKQFVYKQLGDTAVSKFSKTIKVVNGPVNSV